MDYMVSEYYRDYGYRQRDIEKAKLYELIVNEGETSRKRLNQKMRLRPNNVSEAVQQLIDDDLVYEDTETRSQGKGRPEVLLHPRLDRLVAISIGVSSTNLTADIINQVGDSLWFKETLVPGDVDSTSFMDILTNLISDILYCISKNQTLVGIGIAVPGVVSSSNMKWLFNSRWPNVGSLDFTRLSMRFKVPVKLFRYLDSKLNALLFRSVSLRDMSMMLIHWGYGIGGSYSVNGHIPSLQSGSIAEIGHLKVIKQGSPFKCKCGEYGCLETVSAGWALQEHLEPLIGSYPSDENELGELISDLDFSNDEEMNKAIEYLSDIIDSAYRVFPSDKIAIHGPFVFNPGIRKALYDSIYRKLPDYSKSFVDIEMMPSDLGDLTALGCCVDFFKDHLIEMLTFHSSNN